MRFEPYEYQRQAVKWIIDHPRCGLFLDMGLGKTVSTLTAFHELLDSCEAERMLVVAPKKVAETTWTTEAAKWDHLQDLRVAKVMGDEKRRKMALREQADVYVVGRDSFVWLVGQYGGVLPFDMLVIDELTSFKSSKSNRFKAMKVSTPTVNRIVGLTGTPAPNGLVDLWAQMYCIDQGARLGKSVTKYRQTYFNERKWNNITIRCDLKKGCEQLIRDKVADICLSMQAKDYLQLPSMMVHTELVELSPRVKKAYDAFEREKVLELRDALTGSERQSILAESAAGLMTKLAQYANGAVYDADGDAVEIHDEKLSRLQELVEAANDSGSGVLVFYQYKHDVARILSRLKDKRVAVYADERQLVEWNACKLDVLLAHPASTAYGLNMQHGGHYIIWFGCGWNLELYQQANARLHRQGQEHPVTVYKLLCADTVDEKAAKALEGKKGVQQSLIDALKETMEKWE
jgi:SNF2 family DNA or RNA helicase